MKVFLSWSGDRSLALASKLRDWLPDVLHAIEPWLSEADIRKGSHWPTAVGRELESSDAGIICVTSENQEAPWLMFEAGALAKKFESDTRVCAYLLDLGPADLHAGPLRLYQATVATRDDTRKLVQSLNELCGDSKLTNERLDRSFARCWKELEGEIARIQSLATGPRQSARAEREILEEILLLVRDQARAMPRTGVSPSSKSAMVTRLLTAIAARRQLLAAVLEDSEQIHFIDGRLVVVVSPGDERLRTALARPANVEAMNFAVAEVFGAEAQWEIEVGRR